MVFRILIACCLLYCTVCKSSTKQSNQELDARQVVLDIMAADNLSDIETVLSLYDSAATLMPPGKPNISGIASIRKNYEQIFANSKLTLKTEVESVKAAGDWASITGRNTGSVLSLKDSSLKSIDSKYMMLLEKGADSKWKIKTLIWNDN